jgi:hypothetical protein
MLMHEAIIATIESAPMISEASAVDRIEDENTIYTQQTPEWSRQWERTGKR